MEEESHDLITERRGLFSRATCGSDCLIPHPSSALLKFWQGRTEFSLRLLCLIFSIGALISSFLSQSVLNFLDTENYDEIDLTLPEMKKVIVWVICTALVSLFIECVIVLGRFINLECATLHSSLVLILDTIASVVFTSAYFTLTIPLIIYSRNLSHLQEIYPRQDGYQPLKIRSYFTIGFCCLCVVSFLFHATWMSIFLSFNWDRRQRQLMRQSEPVSI